MQESKIILTPIPQANGAIKNLTVIPNKNVIGAIGNISIERYQRLIENLVNYLIQR